MRSLTWGRAPELSNTELFDDLLDLALRFASGQFVFIGGLFRRAQNSVGHDRECAADQESARGYAASEIAELIFAGVEVSVDHLGGRIVDRAVKLKLN
jgi:hypothetical protein